MDVSVDGDEHSYKTDSDAYDNWTMTNATDDYYYTVDTENHLKHPAYTAALMLIKILFPTLIVVGTAANCLVILVLRRGAINTDNLNFFLSVLAVVDTVFLYASAFKTWVRAVWGFEVLHIGSWSCKIGLFLNHVSCTLSAWLMLVIAWQRWYTCSRPFDRCCPVDSSKCGYTALVCLFLILVGANSYVLFTVELHDEPWGRICAPSPRHDKTVSDAFPFVLMVLYSGLPAILLIALNSLLARVLYTSRRSLLTHTDSAQSNGRDDRQVKARYNHVTALLMALSVSWLLLTTPHSLYKMVENISHTPHDGAVHKLLNVVFFVLLYINHSINFFLYCALIRSFRREVRKLASKIIRCARSLNHCLRRRVLPQGGHHLGISDNSINIINNHNSNTDSFVPLLELHSALHLQADNQHNYRHNYHMT